VIKRVLAVFTLVAAVVAVGAVTNAAIAGSPHFIASAFSLTTSGDTLTVSGKEAGLGDESQIHVVLTAEAQCVNPGDNHPKAANKESFTAEGDFPVQNGKANFTLSVTAVFSPSCSPPMTVQFTSVVVTDTTNGLAATLL
jgi:hypothetical protein